MALAKGKGASVEVAARTETPLRSLSSDLFLVAKKPTLSDTSADTDTSAPTTMTSACSSEPCPPTSSEFASESIATERQVTVADDYANSRPIPDHKKGARVFPDAGNSISREHRERFPVIQELFRRNIQQTPKLCDSMESITYELRICGLSKADASPSILVFCPVKLRKRLKSLLSKDRLKTQYCPERDEVRHLPRFNLYFWAQTMELLWTAVVKYGELLGHSDSPYSNPVIPETLCGTQVVFDHDEHRCSTLACTLFINGIGYGLTTAHVLPPEALESKEDTRENTEQVVEDGDTEDESEDEYAIPADDSLGDSLSHPVHCGDISSRSGHDDSHEATLLPGTIKCRVHLPPSTADWQAKYANLDWALLEIWNPSFWCPNTYTHPDSGVPVRISGTASEIAADRAVHIITSGGPPKTGLLRSIPAYSSGNKKSRSAKLWTVTVLGGREKTLERGSSGSLVVDAATSEMYGQVIARSPLGDLYIVSLPDIIEQIQKAFTTTATVELDAEVAIKGFEKASATQSIISPVASSLFNLESAWGLSHRTHLTADTEVSRIPTQDSELKLIREQFEKIKSLEEENAKLKRDLDDSKSQQGSQRVIIEQGALEREKLQRDLDEEKQAREKQTGLLEMLEQDMAFLKDKEIDIDAQKHWDLRRTIFRLEAEGETLKARIRELVRQIREATDDRVFSLREEVSEWRRRYEDTERRLRRLRENLDDHIEANQRLTRENEILRRNSTPKRGISAGASRTPDRTRDGVLPERPMQRRTVEDDFL
ncbi:hypothetical protein QBC47DRAFT_190108 [Echria macrotheca]|uniref:Uncharacterized protein n=1 Tax=Echria macrotheca TaxID=438768 RepID=A0AAJ0BES7_9PEZI|nr:hypothetical protein QBC47DRAFT_190108 [Echria macrotheca]